MELGLEEDAHVPGSFVGQKGGISGHPAGEGGLVEGYLLLTPASPATVSTETNEALVAEFSTRCRGLVRGIADTSSLVP